MKLNGDGGKTFAGTILPQMKRITVETLLAAKERVSVSETATSTCSQVKKGTTCRNRVGVLVAMLLTELP